MTDTAGWTETGGVGLHYSQRGAGPARLVLLHELGGTLQSWDGVVQRLGPGVQVLRMDLRGAGLSEKTRAEYGIDAQVDDLQAVLAASGFPAPFHIAAVAAGCAVAVAYAARHPGDVAGLVLCCPATSVDADRIAYLTDRADLAAAQGVRAVEQATLARSYPPEATTDVAQRAAYRARFLANDPVCYGLANRALATAALDGALAALRCPCLVLAGRHDLLRPPAKVQALAARIQGAAFRIIESGHLMPVQAPAALAEALHAHLATNDAKEISE